MKLFINIAGCLFAALFVFQGSVAAVTIGDPFPVFSRDNTLSTIECREMGIDCTKDFSLTDLKHDVIIIEFLNVYCHTCRLQVPVFNELYAAIKNDADLAQRVCIIGVAVGNTAEEVADFKKNFGPQYPIITDPDKVIFKKTGNIQGTPHTYILRKEERRFIIDYHAGSVSSKDRYLNTVRYALRGSFAGTDAGNKAQDFSFSAKGISYTLNGFAGKRLILYFPVQQEYQLAIDTRKPENQIAVLGEIQKTFPDVATVLVPFEGMRTSSYSLPGNMVVTDAPVGTTVKAYQRAGQPTVYFINEFGRIAYKGDAITLWNARGIIEGRLYRPEPDMKEPEIISRIEKRIEGLGLDVLETEKHVMEDREAVFVTTLSPKREGRFLFSRLESDPSLCDICHDSHFIYIFDQEGIIRDFIPLQLTKLGNQNWNDADMQKMIAAFGGRSMFETFAFDPKVDAVTTATMTSSLIFESMNEAKIIFKDFKDYRFRSGHWKSMCLKTIDAVQNEIRRRTAADKNLSVDQQLVDDIIHDLQLEKCPLGGMYIVLDGAVLCSIHGMSEGKEVKR